MPLLSTNVSSYYLNFKVVVKWKLLFGVVFAALVSRYHMAPTIQVHTI